MNRCATQLGEIKEGLVVRAVWPPTLAHRTRKNGGTLSCVRLNKGSWSGLCGLPPLRTERARMGNTQLGEIKEGLVVRALWSPTLAHRTRKNGEHSVG